MTNPFKGELEVKLGNQTYKTRLTVNSCIEIETALKTSLVKLATRLSEGDLTISEIAMVLTPAIKGGGNNVEFNDITKIIYESGMVEGLRVCGEILTNVLSGGSASENEDSRNEKKSETEQE